MGIMVQYPGEIPEGYRLYVIYIANVFGNVAEKVICEEFERIAESLGSSNLIAKLLSWPGKDQAEKKFNIKVRDVRPVLIVIDRHPDKWVSLEHKMIKIQLGKLNTEEDVRNFLAKFIQYLRKEDTGGLSWQVRLERLKQVVKPLPIIIDLVSAIK